MKAKKLIALTLLAILVLSTFACGEGEDEAMPTPTPSPTPTPTPTITVEGEAPPEWTRIPQERWERFSDEDREWLLSLEEGQELSLAEWDRLLGLLRSDWAQLPSWADEMFREAWQDIFGEAESSSPPPPHCRVDIWGVQHCYEDEPPWAFPDPDFPELP